MMRNNYATPPNPKHAITFALVSVAILILPLFWSPLNDQRFTPLATTTPMTVSQILATPVAVATGTPTPRALEVARTSLEAAGPEASETPAATPQVVVAGNDTTSVVESARYQDPTMEFSGQLRRIVLSLLVVTALIAFTLRAARNHIPALGGQKPLSFMKILAREAISPTQSLALVQVGTKILLVGLSEQNMTTLSEFSESDLESLIPKAPEPEARTAKSVYGDVLRHYLSIVPGLGAKK
ncbi:MAG: flagellar biosynthetic protein FliO [Candidatus Eremiobacteraeota bacterium]|nr:flagellar biosynthetic protein FliO [Candidatus Eremiobacteraeota bacterium]MCW5871984.1 flagellar biosynthetic protein FliO [Candidatus Eremiobacteraeota bacterium]